MQALITVDDTEVASLATRPVRSLSKHVTAGDVMVRAVVSVFPSTPVRELVELLFGKAYRAVPVLDHGIPVGIVTNADLLRQTGLRARLELLPSLERQELDAILDEITEHEPIKG